MKRFAVLLGASGEIGESIAFQLAENGWSLYLHWNSNPVDVLAQQLVGKYPEQEFITVQANFADQTGAQQLAGNVYDASCVIVASGQSLVKMLIDTTEEDMEALWRVHVKNPISAIRMISPFFHRYAKSYIVFISSIWGETGASMETMYSAVKGAQLAFVKAYAKEMAASGTRVNAIAPGFIKTKMNVSLTAKELQEIEEEIPLGLGAPQDIADAVDFLVGGKADYMTGQTLRINGGWLM
ncbi:3-oxoacyl-ACP reductase [Planococcus antarcticus DSM 14505]|uniref:3-ketoacyl-ACP synthase n=1 Tax=Planococcus antarcticus DSM 14505 TaxID=1185653 RepID=A0A1C7DGI3_9BACL|nr:SDR family oxidoreductase [Planococcus antarcticus]ANU10575.1 3-ketoacyl-ACP synthase [Planococcus antarcticus DSM 14505]EIM08348.1 3-oxoacyl-ACP reductase [Planococcus antarcticus DSM 14505]